MFIGHRKSPGQFRQQPFQRVIRQVVAMNSTYHAAARAGFPPQAQLSVDTPVRPIDGGGTQNEAGPLTSQSKLLFGNATFAFVVPRLSDRVGAYFELRSINACRRKIYYPSGL